MNRKHFTLILSQNQTMFIFLFIKINDIISLHVTAKYADKNAFTLKIDIHFFLPNTEIDQL